MLVSVVLALIIGYKNLMKNRSFFRLRVISIFRNSHRFVFYRLIEYNTLLKSLKTRRDSLLSRLSHLLESKGKADDQKNWRLIQNENILKLKKKLKSNKELATQGKGKIERGSCDLKVKYGVLDSARSTVRKNRCFMSNKCERFKFCYSLLLTLFCSLRKLELNKWRSIFLI